MKMRNIVIYDTSIASENGGDKIIMEYCLSALKELNSKAFFTHLPTHDRIGSVGRRKLKLADRTLVCGTNLLSSHVLQYRQWKVGGLDLLCIRNLQLMGVGWWQYQDEPDVLTRFLLKKILDNGHLHSVRDKYTENMLRGMGLDNVIYTACPTMWELDKKKCEMIPVKKAAQVITTVTDYSKDIKCDKKLFDILARNYEKIYIWIQSFDDYAYLKELEVIDRVEIVGPSVAEYDRILDRGGIDYIGTRLHGGIRALNKCIRTIVVACDNRAVEISKDTGLPIVLRTDLEKKLESLIHSEFVTDITLPSENIKIWMDSLWDVDKDNG